MTSLIAGDAARHQQRGTTWAGNFDCSACRRKRLVGAEFSKTQLEKYRKDTTFLLKCKACGREAQEAEQKEAAASKAGGAGGAAAACRAARRAARVVLHGTDENVLLYRG